MPNFLSKNLKIILVIVLFAVLPIVYLYLTKEEKTPNQSDQKIENELENIKLNIVEQKNTRGKQKLIRKDTTKLATLNISGKSLQAEIELETSVYDFMTKLKQEGKIDFKDKTYLALGKFIEEINGIKNGSDKFWIYYVNGKKAWVGVSNYKINPGDVVTWEYEKDIN